MQDKVGGTWEVEARTEMPIPELKKKTRRQVPIPGATTAPCRHEAGGDSNVWCGSHPYV